MKVLFSILVHEKAEVVLDQIANFQRFVPGSSIIFHVAKSFRAALGDDIDKITAMPCVYVNPVSVNTGFEDNSQLFGHTLNLKYVLEKKIAFDYFALHASNDLFVRKGLSDFMKDFDAAATPFPIYPNMTWNQGFQALRDPVLKRFLAECCLQLSRTGLYGSQVEGIFMSRDMAICVAELLDRYADVENECRDTFFKILLKRVFRIYRLFRLIQRILPGRYYAKEEVYFSTLLKACNGRLAKPYVYANWSKNLVIDMEDIIAIRNHDLEYLAKKTGNDQDKKDQAFFAVKRVNRNIEDPIRIFIREETI